MSAPRCRFYLQGNCHYGDQCRFSHSNDRGGHRSSDQYYDEYRPNNNNRYRSQPNYGNDQYERNNYQSGGRSDNYQSGGRSDNYQSDGRSDNYHSKKDYNSKNNYNQRKNYYEDGYNQDYNSSNNYDDNHDNKYQSKKNYSVNNYYKDNDFGESRNNNYDQKYNDSSNHHYNKNQEKFTNNVYKSHPSNRYNDSENQFNVKHNQVNAGDREKKLRVYENEIKTYQSHIQQLIDSNVWPLTCFHPIGNVYPIQSVGCLNFTEVSFEEIRCDYYISKSVCANPELVHKQNVEDLLIKARKLKANVVSLTGHVLDDILATFEKCEESKMNNAFVNSIQADHNSYWDMSIRELKKPKNTKSEIDSFSFVSTKDNTNAKSAPTLKILLQNEVYGNMDCDAFAQENFTDYIPIMPPPRKYCV